MYLSEFEAPGPLTADVADELAHRASRYTSRIVLSCNGRSVHAPVLGVSWDALGVRKGSTVLVTVEGGHHPPDTEDAIALRDFVGFLEKLTKNDGKS